MSAWVSCSRMYNASLAVKEAWNKLFGSVFEDLELDVDIIDHPWPAPIESLWTRTDLLCAFMCGWPFINSSVPLEPLAAPVLAPSRYQDQSRYCSEFLARADTRWTRLEHSFGHRFGYMTENSQSSFNAPRGVLAPLAEQRGGKLFSAVAGPLDTPPRALAALRDGAVDVIALDSFYLDLLRTHRPEALLGVVTLDRTPWTPMPLLVAAHNAGHDMVGRLTEKLTGLHHEARYTALLAELLISRFEVPDRASYLALNEVAADALKRGYPMIR